jgi:5'-3' exonuclease
MWKALNGDKTDNVKGIKGVGPKTAEKLVKDENLLREFLSDKSRMEVFQRNVNLIRLVDFSERLAEAEIYVGKKDFNLLKDAFEEMNFTSMIKEKTWEKYEGTFRSL